MTEKEILDLLPKKTYLYYVAYNDNLNNHLKILQDCIHKQDMELLDDLIYECYEADYSGYLDDLSNDLQHFYKLSHKEAKELLDIYEWQIKEELDSCNNVDVITDLLNNTSSQTMFYDLNCTINEYDTLKEKLKQVKKALKINQKDFLYDRGLIEMIEYASYGGKLVVYMYEKVDQFLLNPKNPDIIEFSGDICVAIIDYHGGSGWYTSINKTLAFPLNYNNIFIDKTIPYNFTFEVCGMFSNWCDSTKVKLLKSTKKKKITIESSSINNFLDKDAKLDKIFASGSCTFGDMKYTRHHKTVYINEYPCGNRCLQCNTVWLD